MSDARPTIKELEALIAQADADELDRLQSRFADDGRAGVVRAFERAHAALEAQEAERARVDALYAYEQELSQGCACMGLDEVGRGPLAGPLAVAAVVLDATYRVMGLNDSKQVPERKREAIADDVRAHALALSVQMVEPADIDQVGMAACLRRAFAQAIQDVDTQLEGIGCVMLDGNPLGLDPRETNVVKGDSLCASIAAASLVAKTERDALMRAYAQEYPQYGFDSNKGYGSAEHIQAIKRYGLSPIHRVSFCSSFAQESLF